MKKFVLMAILFSAGLHAVETPSYIQRLLQNSTIGKAIMGNVYVAKTTQFVGFYNYWFQDRVLDVRKNFIRAEIEKATTTGIGSEAAIEKLNRMSAHQEVISGKMASSLQKLLEPIEFSEKD